MTKELATVKVEVSYTGNNYSAHLPILPGCVTTGGTFHEIKKNIADIVAFHLEGLREDGDPVPPVFNGTYEFVYVLSAEALLNQYSDIFTKASLARVTGINERQLWHYAAGVRRPRPAQCQRIVSGLHNLGKELITVQLDASR